MSELLKKYLNDLKNMLDENGVAPTKTSSAETNRMWSVFYAHGLKWPDAVHRVGGVTKREYNAKQNGDPIDRLRELAIDGVAPPTRSKEAAKVKRQLAKQGIGWEDACKMAGVLPRKKACTDRGSYPAHQTEEPIREKKIYRGEFKQCRNCYWCDHNGFCPAPKGRCYKAAYVAEDYGTFKQQEVTA